MGLTFNRILVVKKGKGKDSMDIEEDQTNQDSTQRGKSRIDGGEPVWTFRGFRLGPGEFTTAMVHFFRAEISRANIWRMRLGV